MIETLLACAGRAWLDIRTRVARWIDPVNWNDLARPKTQTEIAETELRLWLAAPVTDDAGDEDRGDFELTAEMRDHIDVQRAKVLNAGPPVLAQRMRGVRRRRRVRIGIAFALAALFLLAIAGIREVGIRPVDAFLGLDDREPTSGSQQVLSPSGRPDARPKLYSASERLIFPWSSGERWEMLAYVTAGDGICSSLGPSPRLEGDPLSTGGCVSMADLSQRLSRKPITSIGLLGGENLVVKGYIADDVTDVLVDGPRGGMEAYLSEVWTPDLPDARPFRMFVALTRLLKPGERLMAKETDRLMDYRLYRFEVFLDNGSSVVAYADEL
jgi:hypothetical protein